MAVVREELPALLPFDLEQAEIRVVSSADRWVTVAACERALVQEQLQVLWELGWIPRAVVPSSISLVTLARSNKLISSEPAVILDVGERRTTIVVVDSGDVAYARDVALGSDHIIEALMAHVSVGSATLSMSWEQAEALLREAGVPEPQSGSVVGSMHLPVATYLAMIQPVLEQLVSELRRTTTFGAHSASAPSPRKLIMSGEATLIPRWPEWFGLQLGVPVTVMDCERLVGAAGSASSIACGLASPDCPATLNLKPPGWTQRSLMVRAASLGWKVFAAIAVVVWLGTALWHGRDRAITQTLKTLEARWEQLQPAVALSETLQRRQQSIQQLISRQGVTPAWLERLAREFPAPVRLTQLSISEQRQVRMVGQAQAWDQTPEGQVSELALWLEQEQVCQTVQLESTRRSQASADLVEFSLRCNL